MNLLSTDFARLKGQGCAFYQQLNKTYRQLLIQQSKSGATWSKLKRLN